MLLKILKYFEFFSTVTDDQASFLCNNRLWVRIIWLNPWISVESTDLVGINGFPWNPQGRARMKYLK